MEELQDIALQTKKKHNGPYPRGALKESLGKFCRRGFQTQTLLKTRDLILGH